MDDKRDDLEGRWPMKAGLHGLIWIKSAARERELACDRSTRTTAVP
jgi:hypothetical protein